MDVEYTWVQAYGYMKSFICAFTYYTVSTNTIRFASTYSN